VTPVGNEHTGIEDECVDETDDNEKEEDDGDEADDDVAVVAKKVESTREWFSPSLGAIKTSETFPIGD
jgi:hypothetical protein